jgi:protein SCO1/2
LIADMKNVPSINLFARNLALTAVVALACLCDKAMAFGGRYDGAAGSVAATDGQTLPDALVDVGIEEHLGAQVPLDAVFMDESGKQVTLGSYFHAGRPVLLNFAYYQCPMLCNMVLNGMLNGMKKMNWIPGKEFEVVTIGIDPKEGPDLAAAKKETHIKELGKPEAGEGWHFLTGKEADIRKVANVVGFKYTYMPVSKEFAHAAGVFTISPTGKISRYLYGVEYRSKDLRLALLDASEGKAVSFGDKIAMFCYRYDPNAKGYVLFARNFMKGGGILVIAFLILLLGGLWRKEFKRRDTGRPLTVGTKV